MREEMLWKIREFDTKRGKVKIERKKSTWESKCHEELREIDFKRLKN